MTREGYSSCQSETDGESTQDIPVVHDNHNFMYLQIEVGFHSVAALLDSGSAINIVSKFFFLTLFLSHAFCNIKSVRIT